VSYACADPVDVVEEMVAGLAAVHADALVRLEGYTVLLHRNIEVQNAKAA